MRLTPRQSGRWRPNPVLLTRDQFPALSVARNHLRDAAAKYEFAIPGKDGAPGEVTLVVDMLTTLCAGHSDRHAGGPNNMPVTQEAAEAAVGLAVTLAASFAGGAVRRVVGNK